MTKCIICPVCHMIRIEEGGKCWKCGTTFNQAVKIAEKNTKEKP